MAIKTRETTADGVTNNNAPLTNAELDNNFVELQQNKQAVLSEGSFADGDKTKLDGIESGADVTDTANVTAAGALMDSEVTNLAQVKAFSSADYATAAQGSTADSALQNVVEDTTPQLGGNLDTNGKYINKVDLEAISASITDTAVDVFVYDTRKDSDGGAWRKRTQHTSWYNETLNTATRGSRKEFPAVAVIVLEVTTLTIYDGDDPDMPMWMEFTRGGGGGNIDNLTMWGVVGTSNNNGTSVSAVNGIIAVGAARTDSQNYGSLCQIRFVSDTGTHQNAIANSHCGFFKGNIAQRNESLSIYEGSYSGVIVDSDVQDVAMTVLPNAPIDDATGLPIPTIAVATDGGVSVIKDDGSVVDITGLDYDKVKFVSSNRLYAVSPAGAVSFGTLPTSDVSYSAWRDGYYYDSSAPELYFLGNITEVAV